MTTSPSAPLLTGVGMGPGDPELVTLAALRSLREAAAIVVPTADSSVGGSPGRAETTLRAHLPPDVPVHRLAFALDERDGLTSRRVRAWEQAAARVVELLADGPVAFATLGDPAVYSTFSYLAASVRAVLPGLVVRTVPGITAMQALAAAAGLSLVEGDERLALLPLTGTLDPFATALREVDTVVGYKGGSRLADVVARIAAAGRLPEAVLGSAVGLPEQRVTAAAQWSGDNPGYWTTVIVSPQRRHRGGRL